MTTNAGAPRTERQREVDHALAGALAAEVAETTARLAVDEALERRHAQEDEVDRLLATELTTELAEAAVEEVLDHSPTTERPEQERELATTVAAQVAESAAAMAVAEVMDHRASHPISPPEDDLAERAADTGMSEDDAAMVGAASGDMDEVDDSDAETETSILEAEVEVADATRDELPRSARRPLTLVPPSGAADEDTSGATRPPDAPRPLAARATGMLALARDIAGHALASEGIGRALGAVNGLVDAVRAGLGTGGGAHLDEYGKDPTLVRRLEPVLEFLYGQYWRVSTQCIDHVPRGASILVANHSGALPYDGLVMSLALSRERPDLKESRWLVEDQVFHAPVLGTLFNRLGAVRACPENALRLLDEQRPLVVFPEGYQALSKPFVERYRLKRFGRGGFVKLALRTGAPIVPVAIVGSEETSPMLGRVPASFLGLPFVPLTPLGPVPLPAKWSIRFGEPITMDGVAPEAADDLGEVQRLTERTREAIQGMLHALLKERRSVFAG
ncbi:1-acyl-sn-glycerol-3-phosphate acyltransferase [Myxococcus sp. K15C18031901]|uniref:lysophospholipid acyltransferase family protein n=1 Tax=Myxococcus dinghuensis TaxID=2906761 RepID=UPI0020A79759|nr:1-acyl-sn-glycerol-3-phosphate acyltransferase [Myxococcus dinghuensis]MCP3100413.1 1-acyl-sn-glycerol-3-phosphate acyltransferase [Myxococcus dinghuensis]